VEEQRKEEEEKTWSLLFNRITLKLKYEVSASPKP
jgi:hypothetical protein